MGRKIRLFHVEDYGILRDGIKFILSGGEEIECVGDASSSAELFKNSLTGIDVLLLDVYLDGMTDLKAPTGFDIILRIKKAYPEISILVHSIYDDGDSVARLINAGATGFISKKMKAEELIRAIEAVARGLQYICPQTLPKLKNASRFLSGKDTILESKEMLFTKREREVLELVAQGYSSKQIADKLFITEKTVESHRKNMIEKARAKNTVQLISYAAATGYI
jgi:DNA-binding NarL/FixJ family response regulator